MNSNSTGHRIPRWSKSEQRKCLNIGAPGEIRTPGLLVRSQALYPTELRAQKTDNKNSRRLQSKSKRLGQSTRLLFLSWRRGRDSNPRRAFDPYALSRGAPSTTRPPLRIRPKRPFAERGMIPAWSSPGKASGSKDLLQASSTILAVGAPTPAS
jgi:hypothetical protein